MNSFDKGYCEGWYAFVEGFDYERLTNGDSDFVYGYVEGWHEAESSQPPTPKFIEEETSHYFEDV